MSEPIIGMQGLIKGLVQGVFFRASTQQQAQRLGVGGWVRNTPEGHVEVCLTGARKQVEEMVLWLHRGPTRARVTDVDLMPLECAPFDDFQIRR